jgi:tetratricopeptide (TPR) repeat protein
MAETKVVETVEVDPKLTENNSQRFMDKYGKPLTYVIGAVVLIIAAWYGYKKFVVEPKEVEANGAFYSAENLFAKMAVNGFSKDSINLVMNGDGRSMTGALKVIKNYGGTPAADRANYIAGACYLHLKEFDKAIKYLKEFDGNDARQIQSKAFIMLGHAYAEKKNTSEALDAYKKAASVNDKDEFFAPDALLMAAAYASTTGNNKEAISLYEQVKEKYPSNIAVQNGDVDKNLARLGVFN